MKSFKIFLSESNIFQDKYIDNHTVKLMSKSEPIMNAWLKAGFKVGDQFTTQQSYTGKTKEVELSNGKGKESMILKTSANEYIKVIGFKTAITSSLHHASGNTRKGDAKSTEKEEKTSLFVIQQAIDTGTFPSVDEIKLIYPEVSREWLESFNAQHDVVLKELKGYKFKHYERDGAFMKFISTTVKRHGFSKKDTWNPADVWLLKDAWSTSSTLYKLLDRARSIQSVNMILRNAFRNKDIVGISLKKTGKIAKWELVNIKKVFDQDDYLIDWVSGKLSFKVDGNKLKTGEFSFLMENGINAQVRQFPVKDKTSVQVSFKQKGGKAEFGKAPKDIMRAILKEYGQTFPNWHDLPITLEGFERDSTRLRNMLKVVVASDLNITTSIKPADFIKVMTELYKNNTPSYAAGVINSKLQGLHLAHAFAMIRKRSKNEFDKVITEFALTSQKKGARFGPFAKIS
jgi:hypothetical protein